MTCPVARRLLSVSMFFCLALALPGPLRAWQWSDGQNTVLPSLQEEFDQEHNAYRSQVEKGALVGQERLIALDRLISHYKPLGINTVVLESERDRLTVQLEADRQKSQSAQKISSELYQLALQKTGEGRFRDALSAIQKAERLVPEDAAFAEMRRRLDSVTAIVSQAVQNTKVDGLVRKGVVRYIENDGTRALNAVRFAQQLSPSEPSLDRLGKLIEKEYPGLEPPSIPKGKTLVDYKLQLALEYVYDQQFLKAINECNQVLDLEPDNVLALTRMGSAYYAMGQKDEAKTLWVRALKLEPNNQVLKQFLREKF
ncbi:MAG TPA: tetratricopeptide repeat protein [Elusimicrobiota bacterium]|nr:tetratricopeptide repeat protein [Elusimicrobiota bacterium]